MVKDSAYLVVDERAGTRQRPVLLVFPKSGADARASMHLPGSLLHVASYLRDMPVAIYDQRCEPIERFRALLEQDPVCVGFSTMTGPQILHALKLAEEVKALGIPTVFGGVHPSILPEQTQADHRVDYVVTGEGEEAFRKLVLDLGAGREPERIARGNPINLDEAPPIPYEHVDIEEYINPAHMAGRSLSIQVSRGCPFSCTFCCNPVLSGKRWRAMNAEKAVRVVRKFIDDFKLDALTFYDENLTSSPKYMHTLARGIGGRVKWFGQSRADTLLRCDLDLLAESGAVSFSCGLESGSPRILDMVRKKETVEEYVEVNRKLGERKLEGWYNYIMGYPEETLEDLRMTVDLALRMLDENPYAYNNTFYLLSPYPGTEMAKHVPEKFLPDSLEGWADFGRHNLGAEWHSKERLALYENIYMSSKFVGRKFINWFPEHQGVAELTSDLQQKWRDFDFTCEEEWEQLRKRSWEVLQDLFGENAY